MVGSEDPLGTRDNQLQHQQILADLHSHHPTHSMGGRLSSRQDHQDPQDQVLDLDLTKSQLIMD